MATARSFCRYCVVLISLGLLGGVPCARAGLDAGDTFVYSLSSPSYSGGNARFNVTVMPPEGGNVQLESRFQELPPIAAQALSSFCYASAQRTFLKPAGNGVSGFCVGSVCYDVREPCADKLLNVADCVDIVFTDMRDKETKTKPFFQILEKIDVYDTVGLLFSFPMRGDAVTSKSKIFLFEVNRKWKVELTEGESETIALKDPKTGNPTSRKCRTYRASTDDGKKPWLAVWVSAREKIPMRMHFPESQISLTMLYRENLKKSADTQVVEDIEKPLLQDARSMLERQCNFQRVPKMAIPGGDQAILERVRAYFSPSRPENTLTIPVAVESAQASVPFDDCRYTIERILIERNRDSLSTSERDPTVEWKLKIEGDEDDTRFVLTKKGKSIEASLAEIQGQLFAKSFPRVARFATLTGCKVEKPTFGKPLVVFTFDVSVNPNVSRVLADILRKCSLPRGEITSSDVKDGRLYLTYRAARSLPE